MAGLMTETTEQTASPRPSEPGRRKGRRLPLHLDRDAPAWVRGLAIGLVVLLAGVGVYSIGEALTAPETAQVTVEVEGPPGGVMPDERFQVSGVITPGTERPVYLERQDGATWSHVETVQSDSDGRYSFPQAQVQEGSRFRVALPEVRNLGQSHAAVTEPIPGLRVVPQKVTDFSVLPGIVQNGPLAAEAGEARLFAEAAFTPIRAGRQVVVQRRLPGGSWERVSRGTQGAKGQVRFVVPQDAATPDQFRVQAAPLNGAPLSSWT